MALSPDFDTTSSIGAKVVLKNNIHDARSQRHCRSAGSSPQVNVGVNNTNSAHCRLEIRCNINIASASSHVGTSKPTLQALPHSEKGLCSLRPSKLGIAALIKVWSRLRSATIARHFFACQVSPLSFQLETGQSVV